MSRGGSKDQDPLCTADPPYAAVRTTGASRVMTSECSW
jgi:hypothetical protein